MTFRLFSALLLVTAGSPSFAQTALEPITDQIRAQPLSLNTDYTIVAWTPADKKSLKRTYPVKRAFASDGTFTVSWQNSRYESFQAFRPDGTLIASRLNDLATETLIEAKVDDRRASVRTLITTQGKVKSDHTTAISRGIALRDELQNLIPQAWLDGVRDGLKFQSLSPDGAFVGDFLILFKAVADPMSLSTRYAFPDEFKTFLSASRSYVVADMSLQGIAALFYPHHFYLVYLNTPHGLEFVAYFGEDPAKPLFQTVVKN